MDSKDVFTQEVRKALAIRAVNQLIADVEAGRLMKNGELTEVIAGCIRHTDQGDLQTLKQILDQGALGEHTMPSIESEREGVEKLRHMASEFTEGFNTGDVERIMHFYGDSYVDINLRKPVQSWQERREYYAQVIRRGGFHVQVQPEGILIRGDLHLSAARSNSHLVRRPVTPHAKSFGTSKSPNGNRMVPGRSCGAWTAPSKNTHRHLSEKDVQH